MRFASFAARLKNSPCRIGLVHNSLKAVKETTKYTQRFQIITGIEIFKVIKVYY